MKNFTPEMIEKAKVAKTAEELLALAKDNNIEMTEEEAKAYFAQLSPASGELSDDELDNVAGGGCEKGGHTVVTSLKKCFTGQWEPERFVYYYSETSYNIVWANRSNLILRKTWWSMSRVEGTCGTCQYLEFDDGIGYCSKT